MRQGSHTLQIPLMSGIRREILGCFRLRMTKRGDTSLVVAPKQWLHCERGSKMAGFLTGDNLGRNSDSFGNLG